MAGTRLFCSMPFKSFVPLGDPDGSVVVCCPTWLPEPIGNLPAQSVDEIWNGESAQRIRESILDGTFRYCNELCPWLQSESGPVSPVEEVTDDDLKRAIRENLTELPWGPREINCSYDLSCNLACPSCRSGRIIDIEGRDRILATQKRIVEEALPGARVLSITGSGDPFGSPYFRRWLQTMKRSDMPTLERLHLHSNGILWTRSMWATIPEEIRQLITSAEISIDAATPETYEINRRGGHFDKLLQNLAFIRELRLSGPLESLEISMVVQANNFREMPEFVRLGKRFHADIVYFSQLANWGTFTDEEFDGRTVHQPAHPLHNEFLHVLRDSIFNDPTVLLGNLTSLRETALRTAASARPLTRILRTPPGRFARRVAPRSVKAYARRRWGGAIGASLGQS